MRIFPAGDSGISAITRTDYRARPSDGAARRLPIFLDKTALRAYDTVKRRFQLDDGTGRALVRFEGDAHLTLGVVDTAAGGDDAVEADERAILDRHQQPALRHGHTPDLRFRERAIAVGELISVTGRGVREADPSPRAAHLGRGAPPTRLVLHPTAGQPLVLSTDPGDLND